MTTMLEAHGLGARKSGRGFEATHVTSVALIVADYGFDEDTIIAALLHDTLEDTTLDPKIIRRDFGELVLSMVEDVSEPRRPHPWRERKQAYIEQLRVTPDNIAKVVIDEQTGVIVMGENVRINTVAIAQGNLTIRITETPQVSQPQPFAETGETVVVPRTQIEIDDDSDNRLTVLPTTVTLQELVDGLNALGVGPRDMISILQAIKASGSLQAELEVL